MFSELVAVALVAPLFYVFFHNKYVALLRTATGSGTKANSEREVKEYMNIVFAMGSTLVALVNVLTFGYFLQVSLFSAAMRAWIAAFFLFDNSLMPPRNSALWNSRRTMEWAHHTSTIILFGFRGLFVPQFTIVEVPILFLYSWWRPIKELAAKSTRQLLLTGKPSIFPADVINKSLILICLFAFRMFYILLTGMHVLAHETEAMNFLSVLYLPMWLYLLFINVQTTRTICKTLYYDVLTRSSVGQSLQDLKADWGCAALPLC